MKHHGWIVFAIVGLVLVTGLALMYSGGDLKTAGEAKKFGQQYGSQQLPQPPAPTVPITISLTDVKGNPLSQPVRYGDSFRVHWNTKNAVTCFITGTDIVLAQPFMPGVNSVGQMGSYDISPMGYLEFATKTTSGHQNKLYITIQCYDGQGNMGTSQVVVDVIPPQTGSTPVPSQPLKFVTKNLMILPSPDVIKYSLGSSEYKAELLSTLSEPGGCGSAKIRFNEGTIAEETTTKLGCGFNSYQLRDGSVIVVTEVEPSRQIIGYVHIR